MLYLIYKIGLFIIRNATMETAYSITLFYANIRYIFVRRDRELVKTNLRHVIPGAGEEEISSLAKGVFENFGKYLIDFFWLAKNQKDYLKRAVRFDGIENLDEALKYGKGCILMAGHLGNWELAGCALAHAGYKLNVVALAHADPRINGLFIKQRKRSGVKVMHIGNATAAAPDATREGGPP